MAFRGQDWRVTAWNSLQLDHANGQEIGIVL